VLATDPWTKEGHSLRLYNAGLYTSNFNVGSTVFNKLTPDEQAKRLGNKWHLESFHYIKKGRAVSNIRRDGVKIFLDSGAFSAFTLGTEVDMGHYCDFILANDDIIARDQGTKMIAPLDVIGGPGGEFYAKTKTAELSWKNMEEMERRGTEPLPCFHYNEPWEYLDYYASKYNYIALGGLVRGDLYSLESWFQQVFERVCDSDGRPKVRFHAFSLTALELMMNYPWYSVDSSTWVQWAANGLVLLPTSGRQLTISGQSSARKMHMQHFDTLPPVMQEPIAAEVARDGQDIARLRDFYYARWAYNCWAFPRFVELRKPAERYVPISDGLFA